MIAIDTNVLLRYLLQDDENQAKKSTEIINGTQKILVTDVVFVEAIWVLKGKRYQLAKDQIVDVIHALFAEPNIKFEDNLAVWGALKDYVNATSIKVHGKIKQADFPDALIVNKSKRYGQINNEDVWPVYTFDKAALVIDGTKAP